MRVMVISLICLSLISFSSAIDLSVDYPNEVNLSDPFSITLINNEKDNQYYDVKIYIFEDNQAYSKIFNSNSASWTSTSNYLKKSLKDKNSYSLISYKAGEVDLCIKLRETKTQEVSYFNCFDLYVREKNLPLASVINENKGYSKVIFYSNNLNLYLNISVFILIFLILIALLLKKL